MRTTKDISEIVAKTISEIRKSVEITDEVIREVSEKNDISVNHIRTVMGLDKHGSLKKGTTKCFDTVGKPLPCMPSGYDGELKALTETASKALRDEMDKMVTEGLKRKGHEFETRKELETFIKENCSVRLIERTNEQIFYANGEAFLSYYPQSEIVIYHDTEEHTVKAKAGTYIYL